MKFRKILKNVLHEDTGASTKVAAAVIAGLAVGAAVAILLAPESGNETRKLIGKSGKKFTDQLKDVVSDLKQTFFNVEESDQVELLADHDQHPVKRPKSDIKELIHEAHRAHTD